MSIFCSRGVPLFKAPDFIKPGTVVDSEIMEKWLKEAQERNCYMEKKKEIEPQDIYGVEDIRIDTLIYPDNFDIDVRIGFFDEEKNLISAFIVHDPQIMKFHNEEIYSKFKGRKINDEPVLEKVSPDYKALYKEALDNLNSQQVVIESYKRVIKDLLDM